MGDVFDLAKLLSGGSPPPTDEDRLFDRSGKPKPEDVRVRLNSGIEVRCEVKFDGYDPDNTRRYYVVAEIDWENYWPTIMIIGEYPTDVTLAFKMPDDMDLESEGARRANELQVIVEKQVDVPISRRS